MNEEILPIHKKITGHEKTRPVLLSVLCIFSFIYFGFLTVVFLVGIFYSGTITEVIDQYAPEEIFTKTQIRMVFTGGFFLHLIG
jgi:Kef-type K+ transport system membrane component KefB